MSISDDSEITQLSRALEVTLLHASALVDAEDFGEAFRLIVQRARLLHDSAEALMATRETWSADELGAVSNDTKDLLERLESLAEQEFPPEISY